MKKIVLNSYSAPMVQYYNVAIERGFTLSDGTGTGIELDGMGSTTDELEQASRQVDK